MASGRDSRELEAHTSCLPDPWPDAGLEDGEHRDFGTRKVSEAEKQYTTTCRAGWEMDGTTENTRFAMVENRRRGFENRREWELGEPTGVWPEWSVRMGGGDGLDEASRKDSDVTVIDPALAYGRDPTESEAYVPGRPDPWPDEGLEDGEHRDLGTPKRSEAGKQYTTVQRAGWEMDGTTENTRFAMVETRRREFEKRRVWEIGEPTGVWPEWLVRMGGGDGLDDASRKDSDVPVTDRATAYGRGPTGSEAYAVGRPDPWPDEGLEDGEHQDFETPEEPEAIISERYRESGWLRDIAKYGLLEERIRRLLADESSKEWEQVLLCATRALNTREVWVMGIRHSSCYSGSRHA